MANRSFTRSFYTFHEYPVLLDCNFIVDSSNGNGFGARSLKGEGIANVYMNTSASFTGSRSVAAGTLVSSIADTSALKVGMPVQGASIPINTQIASIVSSTSITLTNAATGTSSASISYQAVGAPGPTAAGYIVMTLTDSYYRYFGGFSGQVSPVSGTPILVTTGTTAGLAYTIVTVGTTSLAQWQKLGLPQGITPAVGVTFIASATTTATGTGAIEVPATAGSGIDHIEIIGDPNQTINAPGYTNGVKNKPYVVLACYFEGALTAPANGTVINLSTYLSNSSNTVKGE
jgi:hypothetical protein